MVANRCWTFRYFGIRSLLYRVYNASVSFDKGPYRQAEADGKQKVLLLFLYRSCKRECVLSTHGKVVFVMATVREGKRVVRSVLVPFATTLLDCNMVWALCERAAYSRLRRRRVIVLSIWIELCVDGREMRAELLRFLVVCIFMMHQLLTSSRVWWLFCFVPIVLRLSLASERIFRGVNWISHL